MRGACLGALAPQNHKRPIAREDVAGVLKVGGLLREVLEGSKWTNTIILFILLTSLLELLLRQVLAEIGRERGVEG
jgi:hypothetical protein